jgi:hypothetical protein
MEKQHIAKAPDILVKKFSDNKTLKDLLIEVIGNGSVSLSNPPKPAKKFQELRKELMELGYKHEVIKKMTQVQMEEELSKVK